VTAIPSGHIQDAQKLTADAEIDLFELTPAGGGGTVYFKADNDLTWQGQTYEGLPITLNGIKKSSDGSALMPKLTLGDGSIDLSPFKPLAYDGYLDGATVVHKKVLLDNAKANLPVYEKWTYRVKRVPSYNRLLIELQLATASDALGFTLPFRQYFPPAFPAVLQ
jgi:lambda family phage minor tail protein L